MTELLNDCLIKALNRQKTRYTPVWLMRQAGRYLPEYRALRAKAGSFMALCKNPDLACEVALQPLARFKLDAAILFSDILTIPDAMGLGLEFIQGKGPVFHQALDSVRAINDILTTTIDMSKLDYVMDTVELIKKELANKLPLIGFAGTPWTLAAYMIEGHSSREFRKILALKTEQPSLLYQLLEYLTMSVIDYLKAQISAGADVVMLFDSWGGLLSISDYPLYSLNYIKMILTAINDYSRQQKRDIPTILFAKGQSDNLSLVANSGCSAISLDDKANLGEARMKFGAGVALQGNLPPHILKQSPEVIRQQVALMLEDFGDYPGHIFNLAHGVTPDIPKDHVAVMVDAVHEMSKDC